MRNSSFARRAVKFSLMALFGLNAGILTGCHSKPAKAESTAPIGVNLDAKALSSSDPDPATDPSVLPPPSRSRILESYSYIQLSQAANAYKSVADEAVTRGPDAASADIVGCSVGKELNTATITLQGLLDAKISREQASYLRGPKAYLRTRGVNECETTCSCSALFNVLSGVDVRVLNRPDQTRHEELLTELQSKLDRQNAEVSSQCAKQQKWICKSDLQKFLQGHPGK